uniref:Uncharacterized protein n=1 Tax=Chromera velia CCMP2878 TaxID=1169474 RepID=A0A0G4G0A0_9ALVE|eukprot:Cvel_19598.t1-p1 / transcript=Cvel_19598.t1 / gene=Cvel_19598 / organism=Chromera_velia_CCMP2878 / gene_product=hypothetical protein / transcript_product=hypothetical protein / location=Cvel_scaffold1703:17356-17583(-) / protein_length=76 / sequence_SO=supercontig / SO=protein_coding / is_pseudo=false
MSGVEKTDPGISLSEGEVPNSDRDSDMQCSDADSSEPEFLGFFGNMREEKRGSLRAQMRSWKRRLGSLLGKARQMR